MRALLTAALTLASAASAAAQTIAGGVLLETYTLSKSDELRLHSVQLVTAPFAGRLALLDNAALSVSGGHARGSLTLASGESEEVGGLIDTRLSADLTLGAFLLTASALVGTGDIVATEDEAIFVGLLSSDLFPFAIRQWGMGGGFGADLTYALDLGEATLSMSVGASASSATEPLSSELIYQPGNEARARMSLESPVGAAGVVSLAFGMQRYAVDTYDGRNLYRPGSRWDGAVSYAFAVGPRESVLAFASMSETAGGVSEVGSYHLDYQGFTQAVDDRPSHSTLRGGLEMRLARGRMALIPRAEMRALRRDDGVGQGWIGSFGSTAEVTLLRRGYRPSLIAEPSFHLRMGTLRATETIDSPVFGWQAGMIVRWSGNR